LNENVNAPGEYTAQPAISSTGDTLYFVSKRKGGKGGHDIWYSTSKDGDENWGKAKNMKDINTPFVDISPFYDHKDNVLYFSSNGRESFGGLDVYIATGEKLDSVRNIGLPFNSNKDEFYFHMGENKGFLNSNRDNGSGGDDIYWFNRSSSESVVVEVNKDSLEGMESVTIEVDIVEASTHTVKEDVEVRLLDEEGEEIKRTKSDSAGHAVFAGLEAGQSYKVVTTDDVDVAKDIAHTEKILIENKKVTGSSKAATIFNFENIYFDFNKSSLRPEAVKVLEALVIYYKANPHVQIELYAHTDAVGASRYNQLLSKKRGHSAERYLLENGVPQSAIVIKAKGESEALVANDSDIAKQLNRRVEFKIIGGGEYSPEAMIHIVETNTSLEEVAAQFNMTVEELREMNDLRADEAAAFKPLRVRNIGDVDLVAPVTMANAAKKNKKYYKRQHKRYTAYKNEYKELNATYENYYLVKVKLKITEGQDYYVANKKNTLWRISKLYMMSVSDLKSLNNITSDTIYINQPLKVTISDAPIPDGYYRVEKGDNLNSIAEKFGITKKQLIEYNEMKGYTLRPYMILQIKYIEKAKYENGVLIDSLPSHAPAKEHFEE
ncbi:LysM peptidoglycan-binding domain-containing protein, partial [Cyclobacteriaceae bacterium]|nr:LysM peptidoglycan-binding domain-containing protein [Cyclobacteriaceae bacterium]